MEGQATAWKAGSNFVSTIAIALALTCAATELHAQNAQTPNATPAPPDAEAPAPAAEQPDEWTKYCSTDPEAKKNICLVQMNLVAEGGQFLASVQLRETEGEARKRLIAAVPPGMLLQPGLQIQVDKNKPVPLLYSVCFPNACYAEAEVDDAFVNAMKKGEKLMLTTLNQQGKPRPFPFTLIGFTATYDGPGLNPAQAAQQQRDLQEKLRKLAEEERRKLDEQQ